MRAYKPQQPCLLRQSLPPSNVHCYYLLFLLLVDTPGVFEVALSSLPLHIFQIIKFKQDQLQLAGLLMTTFHHQPTRDPTSINECFQHIFKCSITCLSDSVVTLHKNLVMCSTKFPNQSSDKDVESNCNHIIQWDSLPFQIPHFSSELKQKISVIHVTTPTLETMGLKIQLNKWILILLLHCGKKSVSNRKNVVN